MAWALLCALCFKDRRWKRKRFATRPRGKNEKISWPGKSAGVCLPQTAESSPKGSKPFTLFPFQNCAPQPPFLQANGKRRGYTTPNIRLDLKKNVVEIQFDFDMYYYLYICHLMQRIKTMKFNLDSPIGG